MRQLALFTRKKYRGRKTTRMIATTKRGENHVILKSRLPVLRKHRSVVMKSIRETQDRFQIRLRALAVMETHIHLIVRVSDRKQFANALRMLAGTIARRIAKKGKFWLQRSWSRIVKPGRDLNTATLYVACNPLKAGIDSFSDTFWLKNGVLQL